MKIREAKVIETLPGCEHGPIYHITFDSPVTREEMESALASLKERENAKRV